MTSHTAATAMEVTQTILVTKHGRTFDRAVREFVRVLRTVPDYAAETSGGTIQVLRHLAERVIQEIEQRLATGEDRITRQRDYAEAVNDIRHALEAIDHQRRHVIAPQRRLHADR